MAQSLKDRATALRGLAVSLLETYRKRRQDTAAGIESLNNTLKNLRTTVDQLMALDPEGALPILDEISKLVPEIEKLNAEIANLEKQAADLNKRVSELNDIQKRLQDARTRAEQLMKTLEDRLRALGSAPATTTTTTTQQGGTGMVQPVQPVRGPPG